MKKSFIAIIISLAVVFGAGSAAQAQVIAPDLEELLQTLGPEDEVSVIVTLTDQVDLKKIKDNYKEKDKLRTEIIKALKDKAAKTQKLLKDFLKDKKAKKVTSFWVFNGLAVTATVTTINELADQPAVEKIGLDGKVRTPEPAAAPSAAPEWNIDAIRAAELWSLGYTGVGAVVASMDTGVDYNHADLSAGWRGGTNSWFDPHGEHSTPHDADGHGTQVMSVMVGSDATGTAIGVAPDAQWIAVKMYNDAGSSTYSVMHQGFQWLLDPDGNPNTNDVPDVVNNSWGFRQLVDQCFTEFQPDIQAIKAAEIAVMFSSGNLGPSSYTSESPANYPESFAVGAVDDTFTIASFSGRGPSACGNTIYPEVVAPGVNVKTADRTYGGTYPTAYTHASGTSIAAPHVAGTMALMVDAFPVATLAEMELALQNSALDLGSTGPDSDYGYGLLDVMEAFALLEEIVGQCTDEIKHDGIDQDCNGYDLTIDILKAEYAAKKDTLSVEATSALGKSANLVLEGYGAMKWDRKKSKWTISVRRAGGDPGFVTVSGIEGSETASVN